RDRGDREAEHERRPEATPVETDRLRDHLPDGSLARRQRRRQRLRHGFTVLNRAHLEKPPVRFPMTGQSGGFDMPENLKDKAEDVAEDAKDRVNEGGSGSDLGKKPLPPAAAGAGAIAAGHAATKAPDLVREQLLPKLEDEASDEADSSR